MSKVKEPVIVTPKAGELLPCPFCGSEAGLEHDAEGTVANWRVYCRDVRDDYECPIGLTNTSGFPRRVEAVTAWNTRTAQAEAKRAAPITVSVLPIGVAGTETSEGFDHTYALRSNGEWVYRGGNNSKRLWCPCPATEVPQRFKDAIAGWMADHPASEAPQPT